MLYLNLKACISCVVFISKRKIQITDNQTICFTSLREVTSGYTKGPDPYCAHESHFQAFVLSSATCGAFSINREPD